MKQFVLSLDTFHVDAWFEDAQRLTPTLLTRGGGHVIAEEAIFLEEEQSFEWIKAHANHAPLAAAAASEPASSTPQHPPLTEEERAACTRANDSNHALTALLNVVALHDGGSWAAGVRGFADTCRSARFDSEVWGRVGRLTHGSKRRTTLMCAAAAGDLARVQWLVERCSVSLIAQDADGKTAAWHAASKGEGAILGYLVDSHRATGAADDALGLDEMDEEGGTLLRHASAQGHEAVVRMLLSQGIVRSGNLTLPYNEWRRYWGWTRHTLLGCPQPDFSAVGAAASRGAIGALTALLAEGEPATVDDLLAASRCGGPLYGRMKRDGTAPWYADELDTRASTFAELPRAASSVAVDYLACVRALLGAGVSPNAISTQRFSAMEEAIASGAAESSSILQLLAESGASIHLEAALCAAAGANAVPIVPGQHRSAAEAAEAADSTRAAVVRTLLALHAGHPQCFTVPDEGESSVWWWKRKEEIEDMEEETSTPVLDLEYLDKEWQGAEEKDVPATALQPVTGRPLCLAALKGGPRVLAALMEAPGLDLNTTCDLFSCSNSVDPFDYSFDFPHLPPFSPPLRLTPLGFAAVGANLAACKALLAAGAAVNTPSVVNCTSPLVASLISPGLYSRTSTPAATTWEQRTTCMLLAAGASVESTDDEGRQPLHLACLLSDLDAMQALLAAGAEVDAVIPQVRLRREFARHSEHMRRRTFIEPFFSWNGVTCLWLAAADAQSHPEHAEAAVRVLLAAGASVKARDATGYTALAACAARGVSSRDDLGVVYASGTQRVEKNVLCMLLAAGADPDAKTQRLTTPRDYYKMRFGRQLQELMEDGGSSAASGAMLGGGAAPAAMQGGGAASVQSQARGKGRPSVLRGEKRATEDDEGETSKRYRPGLYFPPSPPPFDEFDA